MYFASSNRARLRDALWLAAFAAANFVAAAAHDVVAAPSTRDHEQSAHAATLFVAPTRALPRDHRG